MSSVKQVRRAQNFGGAVIYPCSFFSLSFLAYPYTPSHGKTVTGHGRADGSLCVCVYLLLRLFISADSTSPYIEP
jgi:hypothetical protein